MSKDQEILLNLSVYRYVELDHDHQRRIHEMAEEISRIGVKYNYEWDCYQIKTDRSLWLLACLKDPEITGMFRESA